MIINYRRFRLGGHLGNTLKTHTQHHHSVYRHVSLGAAAPAFCVNYTAVRLYSSGASHRVNDQQWRIGEPPLWYLRSICM